METPPVLTSCAEVGLDQTDAEELHNFVCGWAAAGSFRGFFVQLKERMTQHANLFQRAWT